MALSRRYANIGLVAFIDLLGYSARVEAIQTADDLKKIERDVRNVQAWFDYKSGDEAIRDVQKLQSKRILAFSDCLVIAVPSFSELTRSEGDFDVQLAELVAFAYAQGRSVVNGIFLRGGIDYGLWYKRSDTIISPAMITAYHLEQSAIVPMIAISDALMAHFRKHPHRKFYSKGDDPFRRYFKRLALPDGRKQWMLDYLPLFLGEIDGVLTRDERERYRDADNQERERMRATAHLRDLRSMTLAHKEQIVTARSATTSLRIRAKYDWLAEYHDDAVRRFYRRPPPETLIGDSR
ncbi:MAG: hypothetical protein JWL86_6344 [Rhizobium sp.]|nr:hypothetical protein [Rhizobium sp.]